MELPNFFDNVIEKDCTGGCTHEDYRNQFLFTTNDDNSDALGLRIYGNDNSVNPGLWYTLEAENPNAGYSSLDVVGYEAIRVGTSTYVSGSTMEGPGYPNIYLFSYSESENAQTIDVYNKILENLLINDNIGNSYINQTCSYNSDYIARDTQRITDFGTTKYYLDNYRNSGLGNANFPALNKGSYIKNYSTSKWPSWSAKLGNDLGTGIAVDPINQFNGCGEGNYIDYDSETCWDALNKKFVVPEGSHVYLYRATSGGDGYGLYTNLEYTSGPWALNYSGNPCSGTNEIPQGCQDRFNYAVTE